MKITLFIPCFIDQFYPQVGVGVVKILEKLGHAVVYPEEQTCCGQPAFNSGMWDEARSVARQALKAFRDAEVIVTPSGSCGAMMRVFYPQLFQGTPQDAEARALAGRVYEISEFLVKKLGVTDLGAEFPGKATFHDGCHGLREMGVKQEPRELLKRVKGLELVDLDPPETCCGFGGTFAVKQPEISAAMAGDKARAVAATGAGVLVGQDCGCLMNLGGTFARQGGGPAVKHIAELLWERTSGDQAR